MVFTKSWKKNLFRIELFMIKIDFLININFEPWIQFNFPLSIFNYMFQLFINFFRNDNILSIIGFQFLFKISLKRKSMIKNSVSEKPLNKSCCSIAFKLIIDRLGLSLVVDISSPLLLYFNCRSCSLQ